MIKLRIERYRDFTEEENKAREEWKRKNNNYNIGNRYDLLTPEGVEKYLERVMDVEITEEQFNKIREAVLKEF